MFSKKENDKDVEDENDVFFFNPDPMVNRMNCLIKLTRELEFTKNDEAKIYLKQALDILIMSTITFNNGDMNVENNH
tara:strand:- start:817 stop:1047 length:231 start_codon:yes stop_codon:yes gene_type:complete